MPTTSTTACHGNPKTGNITKLYSANRGAYRDLPRTGLTETDRLESTVSRDRQNRVITDYTADTATRDSAKHAA